MNNVISLMNCRLNKYIVTILKTHRIGTYNEILCFYAIWGYTPYDPQFADFLMNV